jgi:hypothetical protein
LQIKQSHMSSILAQIRLRENHPGPLSYR